MEKSSEQLESDYDRFFPQEDIYNIKIIDFDKVLALIKNEQNHATSRKEKTTEMHSDFMKKIIKFFQENVNSDETVATRIAKVFKSELSTIEDLDEIRGVINESIDSFEDSNVNESKKLNKTHSTELRGLIIGYRNMLLEYPMTSHAH